MKRGFLLRNESGHRRLPSSGALQPAPGTESEPRLLSSGASQFAVGTGGATFRSAPGMVREPEGSTNSVSLIAQGVRWVDDAQVDSQAMLSAYLWFKDVGPGSTCNRDVGPLPLVVHRNLLPGLAVPAPGTYEIPCADAHCNRCLSLKGGYQFRWFHHGWFDKYRELARPGAWPGPSCKGALHTANGPTIVQVSFEAQGRGFLHDHGVSDAY